MNQLPAPDADQLAASQALTELIRNEIGRAGGWLSFADYMRLALYAPGLGYYSGGSRKFGEAGDFVTAPELSPLFAQSLARPVAQVLSAVSGAVLEVGAGTGKLAADLLAALRHMNALPEHYYILELSAELAERQRATLAVVVPDLLDRVYWLTTLPKDFIGCVIGNEVLDAMPCVALERGEGGWLQRGVVWRDGFDWEARPLNDSAGCESLMGLSLPVGYQTEVQHEAQAFMASLAAVVSRGAVILPDYGFVAGEYYHPQRHMGTLICHYRHHSHDDPFHLPGLEDITTHVDFSAIYRAATQAGWQLEGFTSQASFLLDAGVLDALASLEASSAAYLKATTALNKLMSPAEMGELFKVIAFSKGMVLPEMMEGFRRDDRSGGL
ncbi:class I SAM-dependent methyltransferase [Chitinimonas sp. PSY-7]|uniref:SAM-dependent methyltransferase n=1 Tax=Chitinimonas sp. PSY-7 TaxID=3459088 RepID=UPI0040401C83